MLLENNVTMNQYPKVLKVQSFMEAGIVSYEDNNDGVYLLKKETLDNMMSSIEGRPVVLGHQPVDLNNLEDVAVGYVTKGWFNSQTGKYDCEVLIKDSNIYNSIARGDNKVSSAYVSNDIRGGGLYNGQAFDHEICGGTFTHLAIVQNPRYQDAKILLNSIEETKMGKLFNFLNEEKKKVDKSDGLFVEIDGEEVLLTTLVSCYQKSKEVKENSCSKSNGEDMEIEDKEEDKKEDKEEEKKEEDKEKENSCKENEKEEEDKEEEKKEEDKKEEKENSLDNSVKEYINEAIKEALNAFNNSLAETNNKQALELKNARNNTKPQQSNVLSRFERIELSKNKYSIL